MAAVTARIADALALSALRGSARVELGRNRTRLTVLLDEGVVRRSHENVLVREILMTGDKQKASAACTGRLVLMLRQLQPLNALRTTALAHEPDRFGTLYIKATRDLINPFVDLAKHAFVLRDALP